MTKNKEYVLFFDGTNIYKLKISDGSISVQEGVKITNL